MENSKWINRHPIALAFIVAIVFLFLGIITQSDKEKKATNSSQPVLNQSIPINKGEEEDILAQLENRGRLNEEGFFRLADTAMDIGVDILKRELEKYKDLQKVIVGFTWKKVKNNRGNQVYTMLVVVDRNFWNLFSKEEKLSMVRMLYRAPDHLFRAFEKSSRENGYPYEGSLLMVSDGKVPLAVIGSETPAALFD
jgi:hypothetical protein